MKIAKVVVVAATLLGFGLAQAQETVTVERRNPAGVVFRDTVGGALAGSAVSGGIILYNMGIQGRDNYNWQRTLAWGAVIGAGVGLVWGLVDATTGPSYAMASPVPVHDGNSMSLDTRGASADQSGTVMVGALGGHF